MPRFIKQKWNVYSIRPAACHNDVKRSLIGFYLLNDWLPYFDSTDIKIDMYIRKKIKNEEDKIDYEWTLFDDELHPIPNVNGSGSIDKLNTIWNQKAIISLGILDYLGRAKLMVKISDSKGSSDYMAIAKFNILDWDLFCEDKILPVAIGTGLAILGGFIGWIARGAH